MLWSFLATEVLSFNYLKILAMEDHTQPMVTSAETTVSWILGKLVLCEAMGLEYIALNMKNLSLKHMIGQRNSRQKLFSGGA